MKIGFDVSQTGRMKAGCGCFADSLIRALAKIDSSNDYLLYPTFGDMYWDPDWVAVACELPNAKFRRGLGHRTFEAAQLFWSQPPDDLDAQLGNPDIIHSNNFFCPAGLKKARLVYTLHDLAFIEHPEWTTEANRVGCFAGVFNASLYADYVLAVSNYTRDHFLEIFPHYPPDQIGVIYEASRFRREDLVCPRRLSHLLPHHFWLNVGTIEPRKNQRHLLKAYSQLKQMSPRTFPLVFAGGKGWLIDDFDKLIDESGLRDDVLILGYVSDTELQWLYHNCFAFVYPSLFEGFGLPVLEAMSLGAPVITSDVTSLPEVVGDAGLLVNPLETDQICEAMRRLQDGKENRESLQQKSLERARRFSWETAARQVLDVYCHLQETG